MNAAHTSGSFDWRRRNMVQRLAKIGISRADVLAAMGNVPRHVFVEEALRSRAYDDMSLPLGLGQTISQPYTVAVMTQLMLGDAAAENFGPVLEIGQAVQGEVDAVGGRAVDKIEAVGGFLDAQRAVERERIAGAAAVALGGDHAHVGKFGGHPGEDGEAFGLVAVVVADEDIHGWLGAA